MENKKQFTFGISGVGDVFIKHHLPAITKMEGLILDTCHADAGFKKMIKNPAIDVIVIASPNYKHVDQAIAALDAGKKVILEKPVATTMEDAKRLLAHPLSNTIAMCYQRRFNRECQEIKTISKDIKEVIAYVNVRRDPHYWNTWRSDIKKSGGGNLINIDIHYLDLIQWWLGDDYTIDFAQMTRLQNYPIDGGIVAILNFNGVPVKFIGNATYDKRDIMMCAYTDLGMKFYTKDDASHFDVYDAFLNRGEFVGVEEGFKGLQLIKDIYAKAEER